MYFKWTIPEGYAGKLLWCEGTLNPNGSINEEDLSDNTTFFNVIVRSLTESQTPNTRYEAEAPADYVTNPSVPRTTAGKATWDMWVYENGSFKLKSYWEDPFVREADIVAKSFKK